MSTFKSLTKLVCLTSVGQPVTCCVYSITWVKPGSIQTQSLALRALRKRKPQERNASACVGKQPIRVATASTEHSYWLALAFVAWNFHATNAIQQAYWHVARHDYEVVYRRLVLCVRRTTNKLEYLRLFEPTPRSWHRPINLLICQILKRNH